MQVNNKTDNPVYFIENEHSKISNTSTTIKKIFSETTRENLKNKLCSIRYFLEDAIPQTENLIEISANVASIFSRFHKNIKKTVNKLYKIQAIAVVALPFCAYYLAMSIKGFAEAVMKGLPKRAVDSILDIIDNATEITRLISIVVNHTALSLAVCFFSVVTVSIHSKELFQSVKFHHQLKQQEFLESANNYDLEKRLAIDPSYFEDFEDADFKDQEIMSVIRKRSIQQTLSHALQVTAATISLIATGIFIAFPPLAPIAFGLWAISSSVLIADFIIDKVIEHQFIATMDAYWEEDA